MKYLGVMPEYNIEIKVFLMKFETLHLDVFPLFVLILLYFDVR